MMNLIRKPATVAVVALMTAASAVTLAQGPRGDGGRQWEALNLSAAQKTQIEKIEQQYRQAQPSREQMQQQGQAWQQQHNQLLQNRTFNEAQARQLIQQRQQQRTEMELQRLRKQHAVFQVLNSQQQQQWLQQRAQHPGKGGHGKGERGDERRGPQPQN